LIGVYIRCVNLVRVHQVVADRVNTVAIIECYLKAVVTGGDCRWLHERIVVLHYCCLDDQLPTVV